MPETRRRSPFNVLARLVARTRNPVIRADVSRALNTPLFVEPRRGADLLDAYMRGDTAMVYASPAPYSDGGSIAVLDISGALASRPMPGPSGDGPQNYEQISADFAELVSDPKISAIVLRLDSPGGFCAGCFDLADQIFEARGKKPIHAVVDDMAFSAAFAIAAAADRIWVTRTGSVGSVGVVAYHVDQSKANEQDGVKVTAIYAGAHKIDFSPHFPLSEKAKELEQAEVDRLYDLFASSVARYRGMKVDTVKATEAMVFSGPEAIKIGFADKLGTLDDALAELAAPSESAEQRQTREAAEAEEKTRRAAADAEREKQRVQGVIAAALSASDLPAAAIATLLKQPIAEADVAARIAHAREVIKLCTAAKALPRVETFITRHASIEDVSRQLVDDKADQDERIRVDVTLPATVGGATGAAKPAGTLADRTFESRRLQAQKH
jgi:signal peptide peptidase SppA